MKGFVKLVQNDGKDIFVAVDKIVSFKTVTRLQGEIFVELSTVNETIVLSESFENVVSIIEKSMS